MGKIRVSGGIARRERLRGRIPRPFVVVHSGNIAMEWLGYSLRRSAISTSRALRGGSDSGAEKERIIAWNKEIC